MGVLVTWVQGKKEKKDDVDIALKGRAQGKPHLRGCRQGCSLGGMGGVGGGPARAAGASNQCPKGKGPQKAPRPQGTHPPTATLVHPPTPFSPPREFALAVVCTTLPATHRRVGFAARNVCSLAITSTLVSFTPSHPHQTTLETQGRAVQGEARGSGGCRSRSATTGARGGQETGELQLTGPSVRGPPRHGLRGWWRQRRRRRRKRQQWGGVRRQHNPPHGLCVLPAGHVHQGKYDREE